MRTLTSLFARLLAIPLLGWSAAAHAGGILLYETGTPEVGLAGAGWAARAQDAATVATNPAGMTLLSGNELLLGSQLLYGDITFNPSVDSTNSGGDGGNPVGIFPGASVYYSHSVSDRLKLGFGLYGNFGLSLDYDPGWAGRYHLQEGTIIGITMAPTAAIKITDSLSAGLGASIMHGDFSLTTAINNPNPALADGSLEFDDTQWGYGANAGLLYTFNRDTRAGLQYTSPIDLNFSDALELHGLGPGLAGLLQLTGFAGSELSLDITVPQTVMASLFHQINPAWAILANAGWQDWSEYGRLGVRLDAENSASLCVDRSYDDSWHGALGVQYDLKNPWLLSAGIAFDSGIVDDSTRTPDLPNDDAWRFSVGGTYSFTERVDLGLAYTLLWMGDLAMDQAGGPLSGRLAGSYEDSSLHFFAVHLRIVF